MKRLSYVAECASRPHPPPLTPSLALGSGHTRQRPTPSLRTVAPSRVATPAERAPVKTGEKCAPSHREGGKRSNASSTVGYSRNKLEPSQMRRYVYTVLCVALTDEKVYTVLCVALTDEKVLHKIMCFINSSIPPIPTHFTVTHPQH